MESKEKKIESLEMEDLADVCGGTFMSHDCPDRGNTKCTENPYTCGTQVSNKNRCAFEMI